MLTPRDYYHEQLTAGFIQADAHQLAVIELMQKIHAELVAACAPVKKSRFLRLRKRHLPKAVKGLYVWGSVGVGKTLLMDIFYHCCPVKKMRLHFHVFMQRVHAALKASQGTLNPLQKIAREFALEVKVICFDEFFVHDIADAMLLGELFQQLFAQGICLIATSNTAPEELYKEGLQRERFMPAIRALQQHTHVVHILSHQDYRLTYLQEAGVYFTPLNQASESALEQVFVHLTQHEEVNHHAIEVLGRPIANRKHTDTVIWFDFEIICGVPRAQRDYIAIAEKYHTVLISGVPVFLPQQLNWVTAFMHLIDVFYDAGVRVVLSAAAEVDALYPEGKLKTAFARVQSRLMEMQSAEYFGRNPPYN